MNELVKYGKNTMYIDCPSVMGIYTSQDTAFAIDSGSSASAGKLMLKTLEDENKTLGAVFATHAHADHIGGCALLQQRTGCKIYLPEAEIALGVTPSMNAGFIYGGFAPKMLRRKFFLADKSNAELLSDSVLPNGIKSVPLPGHSFNQHGFITDDGVFFIADSVVGSGTLEKYKISFLYDVNQYLNTLNFLESFDAALFVPSHAAAVTNIRELTSMNRKSVLMNCEVITDILKTPHTFDSALSELFTEFEMEMNFGQYALIGSTLRSYFAYLCENDTITAFVDGTSILWQSN